MPEITRALLRKRAEHNEGMIGTLEELTLHQEELESINEVLGSTCRKIKILYLQNNIIKKIQNLNHMKELEYVNLALNNISKIEGLQSCEFLKKLDLTANFLDVDQLEASIDHLIPRDRLRELYLMGNPAEAEWPDFQSFIIAKLPQLATLDGTEITKSMQIVARQKLPSMEKNLRQLAVVKRREKERKAREKEEGIATKKTKKKKDSRVVELDEDDNEIVVEDVSDEEDEGGEDDNELTENTPEVREEIYRELAAQKKEKEDRDNANKPRERDYEKEQKEAIEAVRAKEEEEKGEIRQKNEGGWEFKWDEDSKPGYLILDIPLPKHLDSSLIDVDVHPSYCSIIIKSKTLRLRLLCEVKAEQSKCQRAKVNGHLQVIMPKVNRRENVTTFNHKPDVLDAKIKRPPPPSTLRPTGTTKSSSTTTKPKKLSMQEQMLADAMALAAVDEAKVKPVAATVESTSGKKASYGGTLEGKCQGGGALDEVQKIVRKPPAPEDDLDAIAGTETDTVFSSTARGIEELD
jgi:protein TilB